MQRRNRGLHSWVFAIVLTVILCLIAYGAACFLHRGTSKSYGSFMTINTDEIKQIATVSDGVVYYNGTSLFKIGTDGHSQWSYMLGYDAGFSCDDSGTAAWADQDLTLIDNTTGETRYSGAFDTQILSAKCGSVYSAIVLGPEQNSTLIVMDESGRRVDSLTFENKLVVDYGFFYDNSLLWVMLLDSNGTVPSCTINVYRPGKRIVGNITDGEQLLYRPIFEANEILCGGDFFMKSFNYSGEEHQEKRKLLYGYVIADVYENGGEVTIATVPNDQYTDSGSLQDVRVIRGETETRLRMPFPCADIIAGSNEIYGFSDNGCLMVAEIDSRMVRAYNLGITYSDAVGITDNGYAVLYDSTHIYLVSLN